AKNKSLRLLYEYAFLPTQLKKDQLALFHAPSNLLPLRKVCPYIVTIHDMSYFVNGKRYPRGKLLYWQIVTKRTLRLADLIITVSNYSKQDILRFFDYPAEKIIPIYEAPHSIFRRIEDEKALENFLQKYRLSGKEIILNVGTLEPGKNQKTLIFAFDKLIKKVESAGAHRTDSTLHLVIAGDKGWLYKDIFQTIEKLKLNDRVLITGHISDVDLLHFYNCARMLVFPSINEGFGLPVLEAMACGTPVIASNTSALPEIAGNAALFVEPYDVDKMTARMEQLLYDDNLRTELIRRGLEQVKKFSWHTTATQTLAVYRQFI
ncbi:MAG: glycosyltransferase family 4 protein, partial [Candidatus Sumerlaeia bacterium]|nr:glycosyltransferase family 4 protein [Candidatus Sumerlaeia bacterium]